MSSPTDSLTAEQRFRQAFERLKSDRPQVLSPGTAVSQNNVAKEAGCDPSALRKARFPSLVREIQAYVEIHANGRPSKRKVQIKRSKARQEYAQRVEELLLQRDHAQSLLASAQRRIVELTMELNTARMRLDELRSPPTVLKL
jgi:short subunit dehydrogenase-like uncharacterized protein